LAFNCPLLPNSQNNLAGKRPMTQKFLATPLLPPFTKVSWNNVKLSPFVELFALIIFV
jgi:hypothetical protein